MSARRYDPNLPIHDDVMRHLTGDVEAARKALAAVPAVRPRRDRRVQQAQPVHRHLESTGRVVHSARPGFTRYSRGDGITMKHANPMAILCAADATTRRNGQRIAPHASLLAALSRPMQREYLKRMAHLNDTLTARAEFQMRVRQNIANMNIDMDRDGRPDMERLNRAFRHNQRDLRYV